MADKTNEMITQKTKREVIGILGSQGSSKKKERLQWEV